MDKAPYLRAVIVGADSYEGSGNQLVGVQADIANVLSLLGQQGVDRSQIDVLEGKDSTRKNVLNALNAQRFDTHKERLFFYFSGHGVQVNNLNGLSDSVLMTYDADISNPSGTGLAISDISGTISRNGTPDVFILMDVCGVSSCDLFNISSEQPRFLALNLKTLVCISATRSLNTLENDKGGEFSQIALRLLRENSLSTSYQFLHDLTSTLEQESLPDPGVIIAGKGLHPFRSFRTPPSRDSVLRVVDPTVERARSINALSTASKAITGSLIWFWGERGVGKTEVVQQLGKLKGNIVYVSMPLPNVITNMSVSEIEAHLVGEISNSVLDCFPSGIPRSHKLISNLELLNDKNYETLVVDHMDRCNAKTLESLTELLESKPNGQTIIAVSRSPLVSDGSWNVIPCDVLTDEEAKAIIDLSGSDTQKNNTMHYILASKGNPQRLKSLMGLDDINPKELILSKMSDDEKWALACLYDSGGYVDNSLYSHEYGVKEDALKSMCKYGFVSYHGEYFEPHDIVNEYVREFNFSDFPGDYGVKYWGLQLQRRPNLYHAAQLFALKLIHNNGKGGSAASLEICCRHLSKAKQWDRLIRLALSIAASKNPEAHAVMIVASIMVRHAELECTDKLLKSIDDKRLDLNQLCRLHNIKSEREWCYGNFRESIAYANEIINQTSVELDTIAWAFVNRGIASWFLGDWYKSVNDLEYVENLEGIAPRTKAWAQWILASNYGMRGVNFESCKSKFETAIKTLDELGNEDHAVAFAWGNYGETSLKNGDYDNAEIQLKVSLGLSIQFCGEQHILEIRRSLLQVALRKYGVWSRELNEELEKCEELYNDNFGPTSQMQYLNTRAVILLIRGQHTKVQQDIIVLMDITAENKEYAQYTWNNQLLYCLLRKDARGVMSAAKELKKVLIDGSNPAASAQLKWDRECFKKNNADSSQLLIRVEEILSSN